MLKNKLAFTLVELIVVITIVGILSTVGFVSYSGYLTGARDSNRISQLTKLSDSLQVYAASKTLPLPDNAINITASGSTNIIGYQGYLGVDVLETIDYTNGGRDPKDDSYFTYYLTKNRNNMQLLTFMEEAGSVAFTAQTQAADYSERFPKTYGKKLGVLTEPITNTPVQELSSILSGSGYLDIVKTTASYVAHISDDETLVGTGGVLQAAIPNASCKRIKQMGGSGENGVYTISPIGTDFEVYCDMETDGGGWNLIASKIDSGNISKGSFGTQIVKKGTNTSAILSNAAFRTQLTEAMACSSTSCWKWIIQTTFRNCLVSGCSIAVSEANTISKVLGTSTLNIINGSTVYYNTVNGSALSFSASETSLIGVESGTTRRPMNGNGALATWVAGDYWELYVK